jgi:uncharacterized protein
MDFEIVNRILSQASQFSDTVEIIWHGGEPLSVGIKTFEKVLNLQDDIKAKQKVRFINKLQTNATLITNDWIKLFKEGNFGIGVSLDGPQWLHNKHRMYLSGQGSYKDTLRGISRLLGNDVSFSILAVVTKDSLMHANEIFDFFVESRFNRFDFLPCVEIRPLSHSPNSVELYSRSLEAGDFSNFMMEIFDLWFESNDPLISIRYLEEVMTALLGGSPSLCKFNGRCADFITVNYDGTILPCDNFMGYDELIFGDITQHKLSDALEGEGRKKFVESVTAKRKECLDCEFLSICNGGCTKYSYMWKRDFQTQNFFCQDRKNLFSYISRKLREEHPSLLQMK